MQRARPLTNALKVGILKSEVNQMRSIRPIHNLLTLLAVGALAAVMGGCSTAPRKSPDVAGDIRGALDQAGLKDVSVSQDRDKGVVTLGGHVPADGDKAQAESIARSAAAGQVVANQVAVTPPGGGSEARDVNADLDKAIEKNLDAALIERRLNKGVRYDVKNGVVTLKGEVNSQSARAQLEKIAAGVPNVQQVVNELQVKDQKATTTH
jgi:hyperosmotically inducible periplasmic protein